MKITKQIGLNGITIGLLSIPVGMIGGLLFGLPALMVMMGMQIIMWLFIGASIVYAIYYAIRHLGLFA